MDKIQIELTQQQLEDIIVVLLRMRTQLYYQLQNSDDLTLKQEFDIYDDLYNLFSDKLFR